MKPPKLDHLTATRIQAMGLTLGMCYQPQHLFIDNGRKLKRVPEPCDPWSVTLVRMDRTALHDGYTVSHAIGATFEDAVDAAMPTGLLAASLRLERGIDRLVETVRAG